ncbi:aminoacyl-tRNA hydrolase [Chitinophaga nivalis]|uniref:peptidyl-tRNA hydrolase n=1 Tax=Chitinophaga nivalis TaxID=2991709 RepID=A0ABT3IUS7_9BACT|nr:aminoacyl-tRNA hydrolase [Chitinophaga nivalis]MCW3462599.1 aminoacyl-tRNA hydrolase [Chitinophaga nivalis]MCW3487710.1 aminoacyl-tRNA hydrolase [Chitinophaga nivalis]
MASRIIKQVIVMRKDLNMRKGKMIAQGAHASIAFLTRQAVVEGHTFRTHVRNPEELTEWMTKGFTKICLSVDSEEELERIYQLAVEDGLNATLITDSGLTEFGGVPTKTCCAIGPDLNESIDRITKDLKLL